MQTNTKGFTYNFIKLLTSMKSAQSIDPDSSACVCVYLRLNYVSNDSNHKTPKFQTIKLTEIPEIIPAIAHFF